MSKLYGMKFGRVYPLYIAKATKNGRTSNEVDDIILWFTGYTKEQLESQMSKTMEEFFNEAPKLNEKRHLIKGVICGVKVENIEEPLMKEVRYLDKLIDELAKGKSMDRILRK